MVIVRFLSSFRTSIVLLLVLAVVLALATILEKYFGTQFAKNTVYYSPVFFLLLLVLVVNFVVIFVKNHTLRKNRFGLMLTHFSFIVILSGAMMTFVFGEEGILHLREGEKSDRIIIKEGDKNIFHTLPFSVELKKFTLSRYPGSASPSSYESELIIYVDGDERVERIFMNNVLDIKSYRFFQASYDPDENGTVLSVNRDVLGRNITYTGYFFLFAGLVLSLLTKNTRFMQLAKMLKSMNDKPILILLFACILYPNVLSASVSKEAFDIIKTDKVSPEHTRRFAALPIQSRNGRMVPMNTFSSEILRKIHKSDKIDGLDSDQFLLSLLAMPDLWIQYPFIAVSNSELSAEFGLSEGMCAYVEAFDAYGNYKLQDSLEKAYNKTPASRSRFDKDLMKLDEKFNILNQLINGKMLSIFPKEGDPNNKWYAPGDDLSCFSGKDSLFVAKIFDWYISEVQNALMTKEWSKADEVLAMIHTYQNAKEKKLDISDDRMSLELKYNKMDIFRYCKIGYLILGGLLLLFSFLMFIRTSGHNNDSHHSRLWKYAVYICCIFVFLLLLLHISGMLMRWYIGGYAPWSNSYETMVYVAFATVVAGFIFIRKSIITFALAILFAGVILFVSGLNWMDPEINPLVPVLKSPWLMFHVAVIVAAYGFFGISCLMSLTNICLIAFASKSSWTYVYLRIKELTIVNEMSLWVGLVLMTIGTFLGAIWANESWGRYWGWDPKETWALITMVVYAIVVHLHLLKSWYNLWLFNFAALISFATVLMTFFGVNYFLSGMHSYGQNDDIDNIFVYIVSVTLVILCLSCYSYFRWNKLKVLGSKCSINAV